MEETILRLWEPEFPLQDVTADFPWKLPRCVRHDQGTEQEIGLTEATTDASVLLIEDMGPILEIYDCLEKWAVQDNIAELEPALLRMGERLGTALANLHSHRTVTTLAASPAIHDTLSQSLTNEIVWRVMVDPLPDYLKDLPDAESLCARVVQDMKTPAPELTSVLCHGDFHNGNVMLPDHLPKTDEESVPIVLDWEFGHLQGRGVNGDAAEFTAGLHCHWIKARGSNPALATLLSAVLRGFCGGYKKTADLRCRKDAADRVLNLRLLRSAMLFHAAEMISCAYEYDKDSEAFEDMFKVGVWYLRTAGEDIEEFMKEENLQMLREEDGGIITSLVYF